MGQHKWERFNFNVWGIWQGYLTCIQTWKCKNCGLTRDRPDDDSRPSTNGCETKKGR